jgi:hypothetical protein
MLLISFIVFIVIVITSAAVVLVVVVVAVAVALPSSFCRMHNIVMITVIWNVTYPRRQ